MKGNIFSIEEFSVFDGPGIRTTVFLKGCPLRCNWCHNPEGLEFAPQIVRSPNGCINCGNCEKYANENGYTEQSIKNCPLSLLRVCGEEIYSGTLCAKLLKNKNILSNGGGVTFSGGEPLLQSGFLFDCLKRLKGELHTAIQTSGMRDLHTFKTALSLADYFLYDLKIINSELHRKYTGVTNELILENFKDLAHSGKDFVVRTPLIPTVTDTEKNIEDICKLLKQNGVNYIELMPYNKMAGGKYKLAGREWAPMFDESILPNPRKDIFDSYDIKIKVL